MTGRLDSLSLSEEQGKDWTAPSASSLSSLACSAKFLAAAANTSVLVRSIEGERRVAELRGHKHAVSQLAWHPCRHNILSSGDVHGKVCLWVVSDAVEGRCIREKEGGGVESLAFHPSNDLLLIASSDGRLLLWDYSAGSSVWEVHDWHASCVSWSPSSASVAAVSRHSHRLCLLDAPTGIVRKSVSLPFDGRAAPRVLYASESYVMTIGHLEGNGVMISVHSAASPQNPFSSLLLPLLSQRFVVVFDGEEGLLLLSDEDSRHLIVMCVKDGVVRRVRELLVPVAVAAACLLPRRSLSDAEPSTIGRLFLSSSSSVCTLSLLLSTSSFLPRPHSARSSSVAEWRSGKESRTDEVESVGERESQTLSHSTLSSDHLTDLKFRFLSQVTKPDYSSVARRKENGNGEGEAAKESTKEGGDRLDPKEKKNLEEERREDHKVERNGNEEKNESRTPSCTLSLSPTEEQISCLHSEPLPISHEASGSENGLDSRVTWSFSALDNEEEDSDAGQRILENAVATLELHVRRVEKRSEQLQKVIRSQEEDIESLRFEIEWKDRRIVELESQLSALSRP